MSASTRDISSSDDLIDIRNVIERYEALEEIAERDEEEADEFKRLGDLIEDCEGKGGDEQWRGDWYPVTLIRDSYFKDYAQELAEDIGAIKDDAQWPATCIDWDEAARQLQQDYTTVEFDGVTYWTR